MIKLSPLIYRSLLTSSFSCGLIVAMWLSIIGTTAHSEPPVSQNVSKDAAMDYVISVQKKIKHNWHPPQLAKEGETPQVSTATIVKFKICPNGQVQDVQITKSSGFSNIDSSAIMAIKTTAPFPPITMSLPDKTGIDIQMHFVFKDWVVLHPSGYTFSVRLPDDLKHTNSLSVMGNIESWLVKDTFLYQVGACKFNDLTHLATVSEAGQKNVMAASVREFFHSFQNSSGRTIISKNLTKESSFHNYHTEEYKFSLKTREDRILEGRSIFYVNDRFCYIFTAIGPQAHVELTNRFFKSIEIE